MRTGAIAASGTAMRGSGSDKRNVPCPRTAPRGEPCVHRFCVTSRSAANACGEVPCAPPASSITSMEIAKTMSDPTCSHSAVAATPGSPQGMTAALETRSGVAKRTWTAELVIELLREASVDGVCSYRDAYSRAHSLPTTSRKLFGSFAAACHAAGLVSAADARPHYDFCSVAGCDMKVRSSGSPYCEKHYMRVRRYQRTGREEVPEVTRHTSGYLLAYAPAHPLAKRRGASREYQHRVVYYDHHGEGPFCCHWCGRVVTWRNLHIDHVNGNREDNCIENLVASCPKCNVWRDEDKLLSALRKKRGRHLTLNGDTRTVSEWARHVGISPSSLSSRLERGWPLDVALSKPRSTTGPRPRHASSRHMSSS